MWLIGVLVCLRAAPRVSLFASAVSLVRGCCFVLVMEWLAVEAT